MGMENKEIEFISWNEDDSSELNLYCCGELQPAFKHPINHEHPQLHHQKPLLLRLIKMFDIDTSKIKVGKI